MTRLRPTRAQLLALLFVAGLAIVGWMNRDALSHLLSNADEARIWLRNLGAFGPVILILVNAAQIVVAPVPGYVVQGAAGWVFGAIPGAIYGLIGLALGAFLAATLARTLGRPFVTRVVGDERLGRWEHVIRAEKSWVWGLLLLGPVGDIPYFLAGLSSFPIPRLVLMAVVIRSPSVLIASAIGAGAVTMSTPLIVASVVVIGGALILFALYGQRLQTRLDAWLARSTQRRLSGGEPAQ